MELLANSSVRRLVAILLAPVFVFANQKLGINITEELQQATIGAIVAYIALSNWKQVAIKKAQAQAEKARAGVQTVEQADKKIEEVLK